jgi:SsrA-binding protein
MKVFAQNKKAKFEYEWLDTFEAGIVLVGGEVKSIRENKISLNESYVRIKDGELWLVQTHIAVPSYIPQYARFEEKRVRKLLMHKKEIIKLKSKVDAKGLTLIVTKIYQPENGKNIKCQIALARGKKMHDKKNVLKERDIKREMDRSIKNFR